MNDKTVQILSHVFSVLHHDNFYPYVDRLLDKLLIELDLPNEFRSEIRSMKQTLVAVRSRHAYAQRVCEEELDRLRLEENLMAKSVSGNDQKSPETLTKDESDYASRPADGDRV